MIIDRRIDHHSDWLTPGFWHQSQLPSPSSQQRQAGQRQPLASLQIMKKSSRIYNQKYICNIAIVSNQQSTEAGRSEATSRFAAEQCTSSKYVVISIYTFANIRCFDNKNGLMKSLFYTMSAQGLRGPDITSKHLLLELLGEARYNLSLSLKF